MQIENCARFLQIKIAYRKAKDIGRAPIVTPRIPVYTFVKQWNRGFCIENFEKTDSVLVGKQWILSLL